MMESLTFLEEHSVCHGDIKPRNIMEDLQHHRGEFKLIDFGGGHVLLNEPEGEQISMTITKGFSLPDFTYVKEVNEDMQRQNDRFMLGMTLLSVGALIGSQDDLLLITKWIRQTPDLDDGERDRGKQMFESAIGIINGTFGYDFGYLITNLLKGEQTAKDILSHLLNKLDLMTANAKVLKVRPKL
jgi:serine/threonine protein kinase